MSKEIIVTQNAPAAIGPYSQGNSTGCVVFTSGQLPLAPGSKELITDIKKATAQCLENVKAILEAGGSSLENAVKVVVFLKSMDDFAAMNEVYGSYFKETPPARSCFQVAKLPMDAIVEIEAIGTVNK